MSVYSVAQAQADLDSLIDKALAGEEVLIAHDGEVVELRGLATPFEPEVAAELT